MIEVIAFDTPSLGDRSYLATDGTVAVVVDPQRDVDRFLAAAEERGVTVSHVLETHLHNDYVTGGYALAQEAGATYALAADDPVRFERLGLRHGDEISSGGLALRVLHTPGHTPTHLSYVLLGHGEPVGVFTGGSMLYGTVGRPDLVSADLTPELAREQYRSVRHLAAALPDHVAVHPTHGFGSHCSASEPTRRASTIGDERTDNPALVIADEDRFVEDLLAGLHPYPAYYAHMAPLNAAGPEAADLSPPRELDTADLRRRLAAGEWVVDLRDRTAFAKVHLPGAVNVELRNDLPTYLGWILPWGTPFSLLADDPKDIAEAQRMLARIGLDHPAGAATPEPAEWPRTGQTRTYPVADFAALAEARRDRDDIVVLDVRDRWEWDTGRHPAAVHIPFHELPDSLGDIHPGQVWVYCSTGARAAITASMLDSTGRDVVLVDDFCLPGDNPGVEEAALGRG